MIPCEYCLQRCRRGRRGPRLPCPIGEDDNDDNNTIAHSVAVAVLAALDSPLPFVVITSSSWSRTQRVGQERQGVGTGTGRARAHRVSDFRDALLTGFGSQPSYERRSRHRSPCCPVINPGSDPLLLSKTSNICIKLHVSERLDMLIVYNFFHCFSGLG